MPSFKFYPPNEELLEQQRARDAKEAIDSNPDSFFLKKGRTQVRILPPYSEEGVWFKEIHEHFLNGLMYTCPAQYGDDCPACNESARIGALGGEANVELSRSIRLRKQFLFNVLVKSAPPGVEFERGKVYVLKAGVMVKRAILALDRDRQSGWTGITDLETGFDIAIMREGEGMMNTRYSVMPTQRSNLVEQLAAMQIDLNALSLHNLDEIYAVKLSDLNLNLKVHLANRGAKGGNVAPAATNGVGAASPVAEAPKPAFQMPRPQTVKVQSNAVVPELPDLPE
jgi:hypothetical protein